MGGSCFSLSSCSASLHFAVDRTCNMFKALPIPRATLFDSGRCRLTLPLRLGFFPSWFSLSLQKKYKEEAERLKGSYCLGSETPDMERVRTNQRHISSVSATPVHHRQSHNTALISSTLRRFKPPDFKPAGSLSPSSCGTAGTPSWPEA